MEPNSIKLRRRTCVHREVVLEFLNLETVANWCTLPEKALHLLSLNLPQQQAVFKSDELLEHPEEDNQQPSYPNANLIG